MKKIMENAHLGTISILLGKRESHAHLINELLTKNSHLIRMRSGINIEPKCSADCLGLIILAIEGQEDNLQKFLSEIRDIGETKAEMIIFK